MRKTAEGKTTMKTFFIFLALFSLQFGEFVTAGYCPLRYYRYGNHFTGKTPRVHIGFMRSIKKINGYAGICGVKVYVTSSYRPTTRVKGAIVPPATRSNHLIGHAIDMNLVYAGKFCNSRCLRRSSRLLPQGVKCFIQKIRSDHDLRWGGDFRRSDPVHIDDARNIRQPKSWDHDYNVIYKNC